MSELKKPSFGVWESVKAFFDPSVERWRLKDLLEFDNKPELARNAIFCVRSDINRVILSKRLPERNADGSMNWANSFAADMELDRPITREEIFPEGTEGMSDDEILLKAHYFLRRYSVRWNFSRSTTAFDPNVLPEVIDADFRHIAMKVNALPFARTGASCSGHLQGPNGFRRSDMSLSYDTLNPQFEKFFDKIELLCKSFEQKEGVRAYVLYRGNGDIWGARLALSISAPEDWKENELPADTKTPGEYMRELCPEYYTDVGYVNAQLNFEDPKIQEIEEKVRQYSIKYHRDKNSFNNSDACKKIRDDFWAEVGRIADDFNKPALEKKGKKKKTRQVAKKMA